MQKVFGHWLFGGGQEHLCPPPAGYHRPAPLLSGPAVHKPDRTHITREEFDRVLAEWLARPAWIIDGDYSRTLPPAAGSLRHCLFPGLSLGSLSGGGGKPPGRAAPGTCPGWRRSWTPSSCNTSSTSDRPRCPPSAPCWTLTGAAGRSSPSTAGPRRTPGSTRWAVTLRPYRPDDCPALAALFYQTVHTVNAAHYTPAQLDAWAPRRRSGPRRLGRELPGAPDPCSRAGREAGRLWGHGHRLRLPGPAVRP